MLLLDGFPQVIAEVDSGDLGYDRERMMIQSGCLVRMANAWKQTKGHFFLMALYFTSSFEVERYLFYQDPSDESERKNVRASQSPSGTAEGYER